MTAFPIAIAALIVGILLLLGGRGLRRGHGLGQGRTTSLDNRTLYSSRLGLAGRPDRIIDGQIPEEWKSGNRVDDSHVAQLATYFILIEEETGARPTHGFISLGSGKRVRVENTAELREWVLSIVEQIRAARRQIKETIEVRQPAAKCRACGMREGCRQRSA
jgi:CRISPR/Cas system-associated exonuclease Cas4 (RecB family)